MENKIFVNLNPVEYGQTIYVWQTGIKEPITIVTPLKDFNETLLQAIKTYNIYDISFLGNKVFSLGIKEQFLSKGVTNYENVDKIKITIL